MNGSGKYPIHFAGNAGDAVTSVFEMDGSNEISEELPPLRYVL